MAVLAEPTHPFYPLEAKVVGYLANEYSVIQLLGIFAISCIVVLGSSLLLLRSRKRSISGADEAITLWFILCGTIHFFFEGYFAYNHASMPGKQDIFGQLWKEYSHSDSRYMTSDPFVLCMETITAVFWGPLSYLVAYMVATNDPLRHPLQVVVSLGQLYGDVLYYATSMFDLYFKGVNYCRPEAYYFWVYYFFMNLFWIVIPSALLYSSIQRIADAFRITQGSAPRANGVAKKKV